jgi:PST family polysaccharide transporter
LSTGKPEPGAGGAAERPAPLGGAVRRGATASAVVLVFTQLVSLGQTLVIARLLSPAEVGLFAAGTVLAGLLMTLSEGGLRNAIVQRNDDVEVAAETVFWAGLGTSALWAGLTVAAAPVVAWLFESPTAGLITAATAGTIVLHGLTYVPDSLMQRRLDVRQRFVVVPSISLGFAVTAVMFALLGFGVWALVIGSYVSHIAWIISTWSLAGWRPGRAHFSYRVWREMARFAFPLVLSNVVERGRELAETAVVGRWLSATALGHYRYGRKLATLPGVAIVEVFSYVLLPAFSRIADDAERFRAVFLRTLSFLWCLACPLAGLMVVIGEPMTTLLLGPQWQGAGVALMAMAGFGPGVALSAVATEAIKGYGRSHLLNWVTGASLVVGLGTLVALLPLGLVGVGLAISIDSLVCGLLTLQLARRVVQVSLKDIIRCLVPPVLATVVAVGAIGPLEHLVFSSETQHPVVGLPILLGQGVGFAGVFMLVMVVLAPQQLAALTAAIRQFVRPRSEQARV